MKKEIFVEAKRLQEQIDYLQSQNQTLRQAQREYEKTEHTPDDVFRLFVEISKGEFGNVVIEDIVTKLIEYNNWKLDELQTEFDAL